MMRLRRLVCRLFGHKPLEGVVYDLDHVHIGEGCARCQTGTVRVVKRTGPMPHPDFRRQARKAA